MNFSWSKYVATMNHLKRLFLEKDNSEIFAFLENQTIEEIQYSLTIAAIICETENKIWEDFFTVEKYDHFHNLLEAQCEEIARQFLLREAKIIIIFKIRCV